MEPVNASAKSEKMTCIDVDKDNAKKFTIGEKVKVVVSGEIKGIHESYDNKNIYSVDIRNPTYSEMESDNNAADNELKKMVGQ